MREAVERVSRQPLPRSMAISSNVKTLECESIFNSLISRMAVIGSCLLYQSWNFSAPSLEAIHTPSFSLWSKIFFSATTFPVRRDRALYTSL